MIRSAVRSVTRSVVRSVAQSVIRSVVRSRFCRRRSTGAHQMELLSPLISWVNPFPSRVINRTIFFCNALESHECACCPLSFLYFHWLFPLLARETSPGNRSIYKSTRERVDSKGLYGKCRFHLMGSRGLSLPDYPGTEPCLWLMEWPTKIAPVHQNGTLGCYTDNFILCIQSDNNTRYVQLIPKWRSTILFAC